MWKTIVLTLLLAFSGDIVASEFDTLEDAAEAALQTIRQLKDSDSKEYMGLLYQDPETGKFKFTEPQTQGSTRKTGGTFKIPKGSARGIVHNHPVTGTSQDKKNAQYFSPDDVRISKSTGLPSFVSVDNKTIQFNPKERHKRVKFPGTRDKGAVGTPVLAQVPTDTVPKSRLLPESLYNKMLTSARIAKSEDATLITSDLERMK